LSEKLKDVQKVLKEGYEMSIMPLNVLLPIECLWKYIPEADYFSKTPIHVNPDPYGHENYVIKNKNIRLGIHMFRHSFLMDIQSFCPIGCVGCYKTFYTREKGEGHDMGVSKQTLEKQVRETVRWLNNNPEVYDIIISGGEPLLIDYDNNKLAILFNELKKANYLKIVRICTGVIFQGLPFRINEELLEIIKEFCKTTGKRFTFQAHLSNNYQFTPEALWAVKKIREKGFNIYSQVPIQEGINFFREDIEKSLKSFIILGQYQVRAEVEPYKYIVDMHPRTQRRYVPIELLLKIWRKLAESHLYPELERPRTLSILTKQGNIILSWYMLKHMSKEINKEKNEVIYKIPAIVGTKGCEEVKMVEYFEPIIPGINDNPRSLQ
jgi:L-lysine 2,3-aminomutase